jgi:hypothetical protein
MNTIKIQAEIGAWCSQMNLPARKSNALFRQNCPVFRGISLMKFLIILTMNSSTSLVGTVQAIQTFVFLSRRLKPMALSASKTNSPKLKHNTSKNTRGWHPISFTVKWCFCVCSSERIQYKVSFTANRNVQDKTYALHNFKFRHYDYCFSKCFVQDYTV